MNTLSLSTWIFSHLPLKEMVAKVARSGYSNVELSGKNWGEFVWDRQELADEFAKYGIRILSVHCHHHAALGKNAGFKDYCEFQEKFYSMMKPFGKIIVVEHAPNPGMELAKCFPEQVKFASELCDKYGFTCAYENLPRSLQGKPEDFNGFFDDKNDTVKFTFDAAHAAYADIDPLLFSGHFKHLANVHVYDVHDKLKLGDWLPAGMGKMDWPAILKSLRQSGYTGPLTIELCSDNTRELLRILKAAGAVTETGTGLECAFAIHARELIEGMLAGL